jgi:hypothetical protein
MHLILSGSDERRFSVAWVRFVSGHPFSDAFLALT